MDSITQAALGAAMGQAFLGKHLGNRALAWGAFAGTIPDLDVFSRLFLSHEVYGLIYHRGLTHSIFFTVLFSPFFGWLAYRYFQKGWHKRLDLQSIFAVSLGLLYLVFLGVFGFVATISLHWIPIAMTLIMGIGAYFLVRRLVRNVKERANFESTASWQRWSWMYFFAIWTHWFIDACTSYGTQIFEPFSSYRISFDNISIVDPIYTAPLLLGCGIAFFLRSPKGKAIANAAGIALSTFYMAYTFYIKEQVNVIVEQSLQAQKIEYKQFMTSPTIGNTVLWQTVVESKDSFYFGMYSLFDKQPVMNFLSFPKNHELLDPYKDKELVQILLWFAQDYYNVLPREDGTVQFNNLRFGLMESVTRPGKNPYIVRHVIGNRNGEFDVWQEDSRSEIDFGAMWAAFWTRLKGI